MTVQFSSDIVVTVEHLVYLAIWVDMIIDNTWDKDSIDIS